MSFTDGELTDQTHQLFSAIQRRKQEQARGIARTPETAGYIVRVDRKKKAVSVTRPFSVAVKLRAQSSCRESACTGGRAAA